MNGIYRRTWNGTVTDDISVMVPAYIKLGSGEMRGGEEWRWILRFYAPKMQWKIDFYPVVRHEVPKKPLHILVSSSVYRELFRTTALHLWFRMLVGLGRSKRFLIPPFESQAILKF